MSAVLGIGAAAGGVSAVVGSLHFPVVTDTVLGWQHHMMLGLNKDTNGGYSQADFDYSTSFSSAEEQHAAELKEIGKRLKDFGVGGYLQHFVKNQRETILTDALDGEDWERLSIQKSSRKEEPYCVP